MGSFFYARTYEIIKRITNDKNNYLSFVILYVNLISTEVT